MLQIRYRFVVEAQPQVDVLGYRVICRIAHPHEPYCRVYAKRRTIRYAVIEYALDVWGRCVLGALIYAYELLCVVHIIIPVWEILIPLRIPALVS